jgi:hypothetical protein
MSGGRIIHMCADIRGMLNNYTRKGSLKNTFTDETGHKLSHEEAREYLYDCLAKGWKVIPMGECDNFDYQTGCKGHRVEDTE